MTPMADWMNALGWTLVHFVWQGALIAAALAGAMVCARRARSQVRYAMSCAAMVAMLIGTGVTFLNLVASGHPERHAVVAPLETAAVSTAIQVGHGLTAGTAVANYLPLLVWAWFAGVLALSVRSMGGWMVAQRLARRHTFPAERAWQVKFGGLVKRLSISRPVRLVISTYAQVPAVVGWMRPVVLVPATAFTGLSAEQIEALLAHELAHVRRHDYLVNLLQTAAETLLFYHPGVWWVSRQMRSERENCCDDLAVEVCGSALTYAKALTEMEQMRGTASKLGATGWAMAADGGSLLGRVQRLLGMNETSGSTPPGWGTMPPGWILGITAVGGLMLAGLATNGLAQRSDRPPTAAERREAAGWLEEMEAAGYRNLGVDELIRLMEHGVDGRYAQAMQAKGLKLSPDELVRFHDHGVEADFVADLEKVGLKDLGPDEIIRLSEHGVEADWIREMQKTGLADLRVDELIRLNEHGMSTDFIKELERAGLGDLDLDDVIRIGEHGVDPDWIRKIQAAGYKDASIDTLIRFSEHGISAETIAALKQTGLGDLRADDVIRVAEHGVEPDWIRQMQAAGYRDASVDTLIRFSEHGVSVDQINALKLVGLGDLRADDVIRLSEHGVEPEWIREIQATGYKNLSADQLVRLTEHGITAGAINDAIKQGFKDLSIDQLIRLSEHGMLRSR